MMTTRTIHAPGHDARRAAMDRRLDDLFWALLLIMLGGFWLIPGGGLSFDALLVGTGAILLTLNAIRRARSIPIHVIGTIIGTLAVLAGVGGLLGIEFPLFAVSLIVLGLGIILRPVLSRWA
jgi:hypothetical protein